MLVQQLTQLPARCIQKQRTAPNDFVKGHQTTRSHAAGHNKQRHLVDFEFVGSLALHFCLSAAELVTESRNFVIKHFSVDNKYAVMITPCQPARG